MLRIVMGLGTKAVDRTREDYPRLSNLDRPGVTVLTSAAQKHRFSQRTVDVLDCEENRLREVPLRTLLPESAWADTWHIRTLYLNLKN